MAHPGPNAVNAGAQMPNPNNSSPTITSPTPPASRANTDHPIVKVRDDDLIEELYKNIKKKKFDLVPAFLDRHPNLDLNVSLPYPFEPPLHLACNYSAPEETLKSLVAAGADPKAFCRRGCNAIQCMASWGKINCHAVNALTSDYTDEEKRNYINSADQHGNQRATHYLAQKFRYGDNKVSGFLALEDADWSLKDKKGNTPFELAAQRGEMILTSLLARKQWGVQVERKSKVLGRGLYKWTDAASHNTAFIQGVMKASVKPKSEADQDYINKLIEHVTPDFRLERKPNDPVGGRGRESVCLFKKLEADGGKEFMSLSIPFFSFETTGRIERRKLELQEAIKDLEYCSTSNFNLLGLQCVSTLDEYCHPSLDDDTLADRNADQVLGRYQDEVPQEKRNILTVPQLWIWTFGDNVYTAMPTSIKETFDGFDLQVDLYFFSYIEDIESAFKTKHSSTPRSRLFIDLLVGLILSECVNNLNTRPRIGLSRPVFGVFENSISRMSADVREYTKVEALSKNSIDSEKRFILEINDIREELSMIKSVLLEQEQVWQRFMKVRFPELWPNSPGDPFVIPPHFNERVLTIIKKLERPRAQFTTYKRQIAILEADAERVANSIHVQLDLKSKHASLKEAHLATLMSSAVIGFTIITIIFTPLAFLVSLFALSINHFQEHQSNSTLANGAPFYDSKYVGKWLATIELASLFVTGAAVWLALKLTTDFSIRETCKELLEAWRNKRDAKGVTDRSAASDAIKKEVGIAALPVAADREPGGQPSVSLSSKVATTKQQMALGENQPVKKRFQIWPRKPRQEHVESGPKTHESVDG